MEVPVQPRPSLQSTLVRGAQLGQDLGPILKVIFYKKRPDFGWFSMKLSWMGERVFDICIAMLYHTFQMCFKYFWSHGFNGHTSEPCCLTISQVAAVACGGGFAMALTAGGELFVRNSAKLGEFWWTACWEKLCITLQSNWWVGSHHCCSNSQHFYSLFHVEKELHAPLLVSSIKFEPIVSHQSISIRFWSRPGAVLRRAPWASVPTMSQGAALGWKLRKWCRVRSSNVLVTFWLNITVWLQVKSCNKTLSENQKTTCLNHKDFDHSMVQSGLHQAHLGTRAAGTMPRGGAGAKIIFFEGIELRFLGPWHFWSIRWFKVDCNFPKKYVDW